MKGLLSAMKDWLVARGYGLAWALVCRIPESWARRAFQLAADIAWRRQGRGVQRLEANLRRVIGPAASGKELRALSRAAMRSYGRYWMEVFRLPVISRERILADMRDSGELETAFAYLAAGRGVIFALPHMGNWEQAGAWIIARGAGKFTTVAERLKPESVYLRFLAFREALGFEVLPTSGGNSRFGVLAQRLRAGGLVCLPADRDVTGSGIEVEFFGEKARMMGGPAALAVQTGAALMPVTLWYEGPYWGAHINKEIPVPDGGDRRDKVGAMTQEMARIFEAGIRAHPQDWHMLQRVFVADLDPGRLAAARFRGERNGPGNGNGAGGGHGGNGAGSGHGGNGAGSGHGGNGAGGGDP
jgi:phosphatidylinositol dimannoside acyltransferase